MKVIDLGPEHIDLYCCCLEDWSSDMEEAGDHKRRWYERMKEHGLRVKLALNDEGEPAGMIQYAPIEETFVLGEGLYFIYCVWVHGHKEGRGDQRKHGLGKALLSAAEEDARALGALGVVAWGLAIPVWMKASWFRKHGYRKADRDGLARLMWKPFTDAARPPKWRRRVKSPQREPGKVVVDGFISGWCPAMNITYERTRRAAETLGGIEFRSHDTTDHAVLDDWGIVDEVFVDGRKVRNGPPQKYEKIHRLLSKKLWKLPRPD